MVETVVALVVGGFAESIEVFSDSRIAGVVLAGTVCNSVIRS